jgi:general transcription factor 3C polypeptide 1
LRNNFLSQESRENEKTTAAIPSEIIQSRHGKTRTFSSQRSLLDMKFSRFLNNRPSIYGQVNESLAVSNAVELFKLVFLSTATSPQAPNLLADILRHYSEHDLVAAFNYLREKKIMVNSSVTCSLYLWEMLMDCVLKLTLYCCLL